MKKENLSHKICIFCKRIFYWRKKWKKDWNNVKYCSYKCSKKNKSEYKSYRVTRKGEAIRCPEPSQD